MVIDCTSLRISLFKQCEVLSQFFEFLELLNAI